MAVETSHEEHRQNRDNYSTDIPASDSNNVEQYGVWVKAGPVDIGDDDVNLSHFKMEDLEHESADGTLTQEEEELLGSLESEESEPDETAREDYDVDSIPEFGDAETDEVTIENLDLSSTDESAYNVDDTDIGREEGESLDDISGFELDLADSKEEEDSMAIPEESAAILQKIENDLLSIKDELTALKNEVFSLRSGGKQADSEEQREEGESGFFEDDEDETIALTGDELDNILNTADITEQTGQSTASPEDTDLLMDESPDQDLIDRDDILTDDVPAQDLLADEGEPPTELEQPEESELLDLDDGDLGLADLASLTEEPTEELTLEEEPASNETEMLDLPEEEEIVFEEAPSDMNLNLDEIPEEIGDLQSPDEEEASDLTFELDEDLDLSPTEAQDLESSQDVLGEEESASLSELEEADLTADLGELESAMTENDSELAEMEAEAHDAASSPMETEGTLDEAFDLTDEDLELPEIGAEASEAAFAAATNGDLPEDLKSEIRSILKYMDQLLESLPEDKIEEFANSEYFDVYKRLFEELGLTT